MLDKLSLSSQAIEYFAAWVQKATTFQLNQFPNKHKTYLYLLAYVKHQFYFRQDILVDIFLKAVKSSVNTAKKNSNELEGQTRSIRNKAFKKLSKAQKDSKSVLKEIATIIRSPIFTDVRKVTQITKLINDYEAQYNDLKNQNLEQYEQILNEALENQSFFEALESVSLKLQNRVSNIVKAIEFNPATSHANLISAITYFKNHKGYPVVVN